MGRWWWPRPWRGLICHDLHLGVCPTVYLIQTAKATDDIYGRGADDGGGGIDGGILFGVGWVWILSGGADMMNASYSIRS